MPKALVSMPQLHAVNHFTAYTVILLTLGTMLIGRIGTTTSKREEDVWQPQISYDSQLTYLFEERSANVSDNMTYFIALIRTGLLLLLFMSSLVSTDTIDSLSRLNQRICGRSYTLDTELVRSRTECNLLLLSGVVICDLVDL